MVQYERSKIYKIVSDETEMVYIGSTSKQYLSSRMEHHRRQFRLWKEGKSTYCTSYKIVKFADAKIVLLESYPCKNKDELSAKEKYYIDKNKAIAVNKQVPGRTAKQWREDNKEYVKKVNKEYHEANKERIDIKFTCKCGGRYTRIRGKARHEISNLHIEYMNAHK